MESNTTMRLATSESIFTLASFGLFVGVGAGLAHLGFLAITSWPVLIGCTVLVVGIMLWRANDPGLFDSTPVTPLVVMPPIKSTYR